MQMMRWGLAVIWAVLPGCLTEPTSRESSKIAHVGVFVGGQSATFTAAAQHAGDAVVVQVFCNSGSTGAPAFDLATPGWTIDRLGVAGIPGYWAASFGAIAPDTGPHDFVATLPADCLTRPVLLGDEFTNNDQAGETTTFDAHAELEGMGDCAVDVTTAHANDAVWAACTSSGMITSIGAGFEQGATDGDANFSEYKLTADPAGTSEHVTLAAAATSDIHVVTAVTIKPQ